MKLRIVLASLILVCALQSRAQKQSLESFDGIEIKYYDEGVGETVLLLHGFINTADSWMETELKKQLVAEGFRVIILDQRGNGDSGKPHEDKYYANNAEVHDVMHLMNTLDIANYKVVGYSRGSIITAKLLSMDDLRIEKAIMGGMGDAFTDSEWDIPKQFAACFDGEIDKYPNLKGAVEYAMSINADLKCLSLLQKYQPTTTPQELSLISTPVLLINGDQDEWNGDKESLNSMIPNSSLIIVPGDHNTTYRKLQFAEKAISFLKE